LAGAGSEALDGRVGKVWAEIHVRSLGAIVILEVVDDRAIVEFAQEDRGQKTRMGNNEVGPNVRASLESLEQGVGVPDGILKATAAIVRLRCGATPHVILNPLHATSIPRRLLRQKSAAKTLALGQVASDVAELGREVLMNEEDIHGPALWVSERFGK